jgi:diguanylate cyclase (GGDEF)-like protein/putative nucleotidyltransferase with HDIG domain
MASMELMRPVRRVQATEKGVQPDQERAAMARFGVYMFGTGGLLGCLSTLAPHNPQVNEAGVLVVSAICFAAAALALVGGERLPLWTFHGLLVLGSLCITGGIYFGAMSPTPQVLFYIWNSLFVFYFFNRPAAFAHVAFIACAYGCVLFLVPPAFPPFANWILTVGTVAVAGVFVHLLRTRLQDVIAQLADAARTDPLTDLLNRRGFQERFAQELDRARRTGAPLGVLIGDIDGFKQVNDRSGHASGDELLKRLGAILSDSKREIDTVARIGGEEFAVLVPESDEHGAYLLAERIRHRVRAQLSDTDGRVTISFGVASFPAHADDAESLLKAADQAVYAAKELGRDCSVIHSSEVAGILDHTRGPRIDPREEVHLITALSLAEALDLRDTGTARHSRTVGHYAELMASRLGFEPARIERVRIAGMLHDIGKIAVPDSILRKDGPLTSEEWEEMRKHPQTGAQMLGASALHDIRDWVLAHHERPDGRGYPFGTSGSKIPIEARILAVADAYEAMTADRPYRSALSDETAREELRRGAGTQFDAQVVDAFIRALDELLPGAGQARSGRSG